MKITVQLPSTHFERPTAEQLRSLRNIVLAAHGWLADCDEESFARAFVAIGFMFRNERAMKARFFHSIVDDGNDLLVELLDMRPVDGVSFLAAALAHADICWQEANGRLGALLEIALDRHSGRPLTTPNKWRALLDGSANLLPPTPLLSRQGEPSPVRFHQNGFWR